MSLERHANQLLGMAQSSPEATNGSSASSSSSTAHSTAPTLPPRTSLGFWESFFLSGAITTGSRTFVAPLECIKIILQCEGELIRQGKLILTSNTTAVSAELNAAANSSAYSAAKSGGREAAAAAASVRMALKAHQSNSSAACYYSSMADCARKTIANDAGGVLSLWRGNTSTVLRYFPAQGMNFALNGSFKSLQPERKKSPFLSWFLGNTIAGGIAGTLTQTIVYSLEYTRTRMAVDIKSNAPRRNNSKHLPVPEHQFKNLRDCFFQTVRFDGVTGLYRGFWITMFATFLKQGLYFGVFDTFRPLLPHASMINSSGLSMLQKLQADELSKTPLGRFYSYMPTTFVSSALFLLGWTSTFLANLATHPFDTIRRRVMCGTCGPEQFKYKGSLDCFFKVTKNEGYRALWRGVGASALYSIAGGLSLALFDLARPTYLSLRGVE